MSRVHPSINTPLHADLDDHDTAAIRAFLNCTANEEQQRIAREAILGKICRVNDTGYFPSEDLRNIAMGKRWVGNRILQTLIHLPKKQETK